MRSSYLFGLLVLFICPLVYGQNEKSNLEKYWRYRDRFDKDFIVLPSDVNSAIDKAGVSVPALTWKLTTDNKKDILDFTDGNANFSHYLGVLSTEYRLLKNGGYNYDETIKRLYYAFKAIDRIDQNSESFFRSDRSVQSSDKNGWMIRDDVTPQFWSNNCSKLGLPGTGVDHFVSGYAGFNNSQDGHTKESVSQDNIFHLLEGLALVNKLVGSEYVAVAAQTVDFSAWSKDLTTRVIKMMQHSNKIYLVAKDKNSPFDCKISPPTWWEFVIAPDWATLQLTMYNALCGGFNSRWYIQNPVTGEMAYEGSGQDFDLWSFYTYGLTRAGNKITNTSFDFDNSSGTLQQNLYTSWYQGNYTNSVDQVQNAIGSFVFDFIGGIGAPTLPANVKTDIVKKLASSIFNYDADESTIDKDPYKIKTLATVGNIFGEQTFWDLRNVELVNNKRYIQFMLMYIVLHGQPAAYSASSTEYKQDKTYFNQLLALAPCKGPRNFRVSDSDDFYIEWSASSRLVWPENEGIYAAGSSKRALATKMEHNGLDYMLLHNLYCLVYQTDFRKLTVQETVPIQSSTMSETAVDIFTSNQLSGTATVNYQATNSIHLVPGFSGVAGTNFDAKIVGSSIDYSGFSQNNPCSYTFSGRLPQAIVAEPPLGKKNNSELILVPNPSNGKFTVHSSTEENLRGKLTVKDLTGRNVYVGTLQKNGDEIDLGSMPQGLYLVIVHSGNKVFQQKLIIE
jgi:hypothetical protein